MNPSHPARADALIIGCGDTGARVARMLLARGQRVIAVVRSNASASHLAGQGIEARAIDLDASPQPLPDADCVYWFAPPPNTGVTDPRLRAWLPLVQARRLVYISTTGVYGDCGGRWIDETEPLKPQTDRARRRVDAENALAEHAAGTGLEVVTLRVPGIYGPGRLPLERLQRGTPVIIEEQCPPTNRIHAEDLAGAAIAAAKRGAAGAAYNIGDGVPSTMTAYFVGSARLLGLPEPPRVTLDEARKTFNAAMLSFLEEPKRLLVARMRTELGYTPRYADLAAGLPSCLADPS